MQKKNTSKIKKIYLLILVIPIIVLFADNYPFYETLELSDEFKTKLNTNVKNGFHPNIIIGLVDSDGIKYIPNGTISKDSNIPVNENSVYEIASISKLFTGLILADMINGGEIKLDDPIEKYLPKSVNIPTVNGTKITIKHLVTHSSGLPRLPDNISPKNWETFYSSYTVQQMYDFLSDYELKTEPGEFYEYSNLGNSL